MATNKSQLNKSLKGLKRVRWKVAGPLLVCAVLCVYLVISLTIGLINKAIQGGNDRKNQSTITTICNYNAKKTLNAVSSEDKTNVVEVVDYNFYGESLNLYFSEYNLGISNSKTLNGKKVVVEDLCSTTTYSFDCSKEVDNGIDLSKLTPGFYAVYIVTGEEESAVKERVYMRSVIVTNNKFTTVTRDGQSMLIELIGDAGEFNEENATENYLDQNYLYLKVTAITKEENGEYDIAISTAPALVESGVSLSGYPLPGGYKEAEELWDVANEMKAKLEEAGLKVIILKDGFDEEIMYYGQGGVLAKAYSSKAKYLIHLDIYDYNVKGVTYSGSSSGKLASSIFDSVKKVVSYYTSDDDLFAAATTEEGFDSRFEIREAGGKVLGAGTYSESSKENESFAATNKYGMDTVVVMPVLVNSSSEVADFVANKIAFADAIVEGILNYLK